MRRPTHPPAPHPVLSYAPPCCADVDFIESSARKKADVEDIFLTLVRQIHTQALAAPAPAASAAPKRFCVLLYPSFLTAHPPSPSSSRLYFQSIIIFYPYMSPNAGGRGVRGLERGRVGAN